MICLSESDFGILCRDCCEILKKSLRKMEKLPRIRPEAIGRTTEKGNPPCGERKATGREASRVACLEIGLHAEPKDGQ